MLIKGLKVLSLAALISNSVNAGDFLGLSFSSRDRERDINDCRVEGALHTSEFNAYGLGREVWRVQDPKVNEALAADGRVEVDYSQHNALVAHLCDVGPQSTSLITRLDFHARNDWKIRALNAFFLQLSNHSYERERIVVWVKVEDELVAKLLLTRFGFEEHEEEFYAPGECQRHIRHKEGERQFMTSASTLRSHLITY